MCILSSLIRSFIPCHCNAIFCCITLLPLSLECEFPEVTHYVLSTCEIQCLLYLLHGGSSIYTFE